MAGIRVVKGAAWWKGKRCEGFEYYAILRAYAVIEEVDFLILMTM